MKRTNTWTLRGWENWEIGIDRYTLLCGKQITNENVLYSTGGEKMAQSVCRPYNKLTLKMHCNI